MQKNIDNQEVAENLIEEFYVENYNFVKNEDISEQACKFINNFIRLVADAFRDLKSIDKNIERSINAMKNKDKDNYESKKHSYFIEINKKAKLSKENYILNKLLSELKKRMKLQQNGLEKVGMFEKDDNYSWYKEYYDPEYDFSVSVKFFDAFHFHKDKVAELIKLKKTNEDKYYEYVKDFISHKKVSNYILSNVKNNYILKIKKEVFVILLALFQKSAYQTFVSLGAIQVEGLFYDFCSAIKGGERNVEEGTIINKLDKVFEDNEIQKLMYYPYFAFEVPIYRNEVAHNGIMNDKQIEHRAYDILLDMYSIIKLMQRDSLPFNNVYFLIFQIKEYSKAKDYSEENYYYILDSLIDCQHSNVIGKGKFSIYSIIKNIEKYEPILRTYEIYYEDKRRNLNIYEEGLKLRKTFYDDNFWEYLLKTLSEHDNENLNKLLRQMCNEFISVLPGSNQAKKSCIEIKKLLDKREQFS
ncbi:hypothetical protein [Clostridium acetobutylicum]|uniref:hypothetical protein n=1 Tax=Clostridium acetobutylicum TaxID=1488 RepID=UPI00185A0762|nr:hypothetical protein [Clostridium acetobutylicum]NYC95022.1 hypothetical protein [Clostridium acetobutylicum]